MSLEIRGLAVRLGGERIIHDLDLDVSTGERFVIMGPSGSGKSTLLRSIAGLITPSAGTIRIDDVDVTEVPTHKRPIGLMFQDHALFPHMSVIDNVAYGLRMAGVDRDARRTTAKELLALVGLSEFGSRKPETLSGGEQQRVALARTIALDPSLVMFDEPLGSLDIALRDDLLLHIMSVIADVGTTSLYVTHDRNEAFTFADRLAVIRDGQVEALGTPSAVWDDPRTAFVARLIGHTNVVDGSALGLGAGMVTIPDGSVTIQRDGSTVSEVVDSSFDDGRFRVRVDVDGTILTVDSSRPVPPGSQLRLNIDVSSTKRLTS